MKIISLISACLLFTAVYSTQNITLKLSAGEKIEMDYPQYEHYSVALNNLSRQQVEVSVIDKETGKQKSGFGLANKSKESISLSRNSKLVLENKSQGNIKLKLVITPIERPLQKKNNASNYITFTLQNTTALSIPLLIPSVMNPNLSPFSKSGVRLKVGQEILFRKGLKKYVLLTVTPAIAEGSTLNVAQILKEREKELGL